MKFYQILLFSFVASTLLRCVPVSNSNYVTDKKLLTDNLNYEANVGMVQLYPYNQNLSSDLENPVIPINDPNGFYLEFDLFQETYASLNVRYIHCNRDWSPSNLTSIRFLNEYNSFNITSFQYSANTVKPYVKYDINLPAPSISGNYLVVVSNSQSDRDIILSRRVIVYSNVANATGEVKLSNSVMNRAINQQVAFTVSYQGLDNVNPLRDLYVVLMQNHNWKTTIKGLQPTLVRHDQSFLEYFHFNSENNFPGMNEFRFFDLRSIDYRGMNVVNVQKEENRVLAFLGLDKPRGGLAYSNLINDLNGGYYLVNSDPGDSQLQSEYVDVYFELVSDEIEGHVFVAGQFNNWRLDDQNIMKYDPARNSYRTKLLLKQGYYDYMFWADSPNLVANYFEGNHYQTRNNYEILVYYRDPINNYDELIGYKNIKTNF
ncbi:MAG: hypothetical protein ACJA08_001841 [Cyclobacteriaceae bacterium]|jgi:hypothetical protein